METRISLEKISEQDFEAYYSLAGNTRVMETITGKPLTREETRKKFNSLLENGKLHESYGCFKVSDSIKKELLGFGKLEITKERPVEAELGYLLEPEFWGRGYGSEIAAQLMKKAEAAPELTRVFAITDPGNMASRRILLGLGFESEQKGEMDGLPSEVFGKKLK